MTWVQQFGRATQLPCQTSTLILSVAVDLVREDRLIQLRQVGTWRCRCNSHQ